MSAAFEALAGRWQTFVGKVEQRLGEVMAEAEVGLDEVIAAEVVDPGPLSQAIQVVRARLHGLSQKVDESWDKIDGEIDAILEPMDVGPDWEALQAKRSALRRAGWGLREKIDLQVEIFRVKKEADAARALWAIVEKEMTEERTCERCGVTLRPGILRAPTSFPCPSCKAVHALRPGLAAAMFFQGGKVHSLAEETALGAWMELRIEEKRYQALRHPADEDRARFEAATLAYWRAYCAAYARHDPAWTPEHVEKEIAGRMGQFRAFDSEADTRGRMGEILRLAKAGDAAGATRVAAARGDLAGSFASDAAEAAIERGDRAAATLLLGVQFDLERPGDPKSAWIKERLAETTKWLASMKT